MGKLRIVRPLRVGRIKVICFDLNGTLTAWKEGFDGAFRESVEEWVGRWEGERGATEISAIVLADYKSARKGADHTTALRRAFRRLPMAVDDHTLAFIQNRIGLLQAGRSSWIDGAEEAVRQLSAKYRIAAITNLSQPQAKIVWRQLQLQRYMREEHLFTASGTLRKPHKAIFRHAANTLGLEPQQCLMVGDSYRNDYLGAQRAGWQSVWIRKNTSDRLRTKRTETIVSSIKALPRLLLPREAPS